MVVRPTVPDRPRLDMATVETVERRHSLPLDKGWALTHVCGGVT